MQNSSFFCNARSDTICRPATSCRILVAPKSSMFNKIINFQRKNLEFVLQNLHFSIQQTHVISFRSIAKKLSPRTSATIV